MSLIDGGYLDFQEQSYSSPIDHDDTTRETTTRERENFCISDSNDDNIYESPIGKKIVIISFGFSAKMRDVFK